MNAGLALTAGEQYTISFSLTSEGGVGEFFLCRSENIDDRYDQTFAAEAGDRSIAFTAAQDRVYIGMQVGNLGKGRSVTAAITNLSALADSENPGLLRAENCAVVIQDGVITATDICDNNDVWNSKLLYQPGIALEPGKTYSMSFNLTGENGVGEFFVCKSQDLNDRYDATFVNQAGEHTVSFTATGDQLFIGLQFGNLGAGSSVSFSMEELKQKQKRAAASIPPLAPANPTVLLSENCTYEIQSAEEQTVIRAVDTSENNDVWSSKLLVFLGEILEESSIYAANFNLDGSSGKVGEFFFCKQDNLDDRYSFDDQPGDHTAVFQAEDSKLYAGMQIGNVGEGNEVTVTIGDIFRIPGQQTSSENCAQALSQDSITLTDTDDNNDVWNSKAIFNSGITLEPGVEYTATFTLTGDNGVGEFFFLKANDIDQRYTFDNVAGTHTVTFTATGAELFFGIQCGNIGNGNSVTVSDLSVTPSAPETETADVNAIPEETAEEEAPEAVPADEPAAGPAGEETDEEILEAVFADEPAAEPTEGVIEPTDSEQGVEAAVDVQSVDVQASGEEVPAEDESV